VRDRSEEPECVGGGGTLGLLAAGLVVLVLVALALLLGPAVADDPTALAPGRLLATWAAR
jgi:hypothetical protein